MSSSAMAAIAGRPLVMSRATEPVAGSSRWASVELPAALEPRPEISHVLFDFDGTLSLIRQGWPEVMVPMFVEALPRLPGETDEQVEQLVLDDIMRLNGKQTIYQMIQLAERIEERGGQAREPLWYKHEYLRRLERTSAPAPPGSRAARSRPISFLVHGARPLLKHLRDRGLHLYLASGTDLSAVKREAALLDITSDFGPNIYGALDDYKQFSKKMIIDRILHEHGITGRQLLSFGDGYVEIENTKQVGGLAVAVASDEAHNGSGRVDEWKRRRCWESAPMPSSPIFVTPSHSSIICWAAEDGRSRTIGLDCEVSDRERDTTRLEQAQGLSPRRAQEPDAGRRDPDRARRSLEAVHRAGRVVDRRLCARRSRLPARAGRPSC